MEPGHDSGRLATYDDDDQDDDDQDDQMNGYDDELDVKPFNLGSN
jgi:hypothetical protein